VIKSSAKNSKSDLELVADYKVTGDTVCIEILFNRYCHLVFAVAMKYLHNAEESKDAVIDIFEKVPKDISLYDIRNFSNWLFVITKNHCFRLLKKRKSAFPEDALDSGAQEFWEDAGDDDLEKLLVEHLEESLKTLNEEQRICISLFYLKEKSYVEIEQTTGFTYKQVKSHIQNGKRNLKIYLGRFLK
jgi:RNA polymerase sigma-70 factor (ECF subfamily)